MNREQFHAVGVDILKYVNSLKIMLGENGKFYSEDFKINQNQIVCMITSHVKELHPEFAKAKLRKLAKRILEEDKKRIMQSFLSESETSKSPQH